MMLSGLRRIEIKHTMRALKMLIAIIGIILFFRISIADMSIVDQNSMQPTFKPGDFILVEKISALFTDYRRNDVVQVFSPETNAVLIKRIIGLPGEAVANLNDEMQIIDANGNSTQLKEPYTTKHAFTSKRLGAHEYFVMGDNRDASTDSRSFGPISQGQIIGRIVASWNRPIK